MKEILYLDNTMLNSYLAQMDSGLITSLVNSLQMDLSESETVDSNIKENISGGFNALMKGDYSRSKDNGTTNNTTYTKRDTESQQIAYHDYALDVFIEKISTDEELQKAFVFPDGKLAVFNFERLEAVMKSDLFNIFNPEMLHNERIDSEIKQIRSSPTYKQNKANFNRKIAKLNSKKQTVNQNFMLNVEYVHRLGKMGNALFPNSCLIKINNYICICPKHHFRLDEPALALLNESKKTAKCIGVMIYERQSDHIQKDAEGNVLQLSVETIAASATTIIMDILLDNSQLSKRGDIVFRPLAIYYES